MRARLIVVVSVAAASAAMASSSPQQGRLERGQLGLVLNVLDRDGDGWGEVLSSLTGYEGMTITLREYSPTGFQPTNISFSQGC